MTTPRARWQIRPCDPFYAPQAQGTLTMLRSIRDVDGDPAPPQEEERRAADDLAPLAARGQCGDRKAIATLLASLAPSMLQVIRRMTGVRAAHVDDLFQDAAFGFVQSL